MFKNGLDWVQQNAKAIHRYGVYAVTFLGALFLAYFGIKAMLGCGDDGDPDEAANTGPHPTPSRPAPNPNKQQHPPPTTTCRYTQHHR